MDAGEGHGEGREGSDVSGSVVRVQWEGKVMGCIPPWDAAASSVRAPGRCIHNRWGAYVNLPQINIRNYTVYRRATFQAQI